MKYLVDTAWTPDYLADRNGAIQLLQPLAEEGLAISLVTYGEIL